MWPRYLFAVDCALTDPLLVHHNDITLTLTILYFILLFRTHLNNQKYTLTPTSKHRIRLNFYYKINTPRNHSEQTMHYLRRLLSQEIESYVNLIEANIANCLRRSILLCPSGYNTPSHKYEALIRSYHAGRSANEWCKDQLMHPCIATL